MSAIILFTGCCCAFSHMPTFARWRVLLSWLVYFWASSLPLRSPGTCRRSLPLKLSGSRLLLVSLLHFCLIMVGGELEQCSCPFLLVCLSHFLSLRKEGKDTSAIWKGEFVSFAAFLPGLLTPNILTAWHVVVNVDRMEGAGGSPLLTAYPVSDILLLPSAPSARSHSLRLHWHFCVTSCLDPPHTGNF